MARTKTIKTIRDLTPDQNNANRHSQRGMGMMETSLTECGFGDSLTVDRNGAVISGNGRLETLAAIDMAEAIVVQSDGTRAIVHQRTDLDLSKDAKAKRLAVLQNRVGQVNLDWDAGVLAQLAEDGVELDDLFSSDELTELLNDEPKESGGGGDEFEAEPDEKQTRVQYGDLWACGNHRVLCGDSTKAEDVARLMDGEKAGVIITSPPYNLGNNHHTADKKTQAYSDDKEESEYQREQSLLLSLLSEYCEGDCFYQHKNRIKKGQWISPFEWVRTKPWRIVQEIVWINGGPNMDNCRFYPQTERIYWLTKNGSATNFHNHEHLTDWWQLAPVGTDGEHTRAYPVEIPQRLMVASGAKSVLEPYCGSGTTLIAAERTNRKCYGIEISPKYVDVILKRYEKETGNTPELIERAK